MENSEAFFRTIDYYVNQIQTEHQISSVKSRQHHTAIALQWVKGLQGATSQFRDQLIANDKTNPDITQELEKITSSLTDLEHHFSSIKDNSKDKQVYRITADISISNIQSSYKQIRRQIDNS